MKYLVILAFLPFALFAQSNQQKLPGFWVKVKACMKDGSSIIDHNGCGMDFLRCTFTSDGAVNMSSEPLFDYYYLPYKVSGDSLFMRRKIYDIVSLTQDTLKLSFFMPGVEDSQVPVYYFAKVQNHDVVATATFDAVLKDSVYQATNELFPQCKGEKLALMNHIHTYYEQGTLKANFIIDKKGKVESYTILSADTMSSGFAKKLCRAFGDVAWRPAIKNRQPVTCIVQVTIHTSSSLLSGTYKINNMNVEYDFLPKAPYPIMDPDDFGTSQQYLKDAVNLYNSRNYDKAVELLTRCIKIDNINLSAYNFRAFINANRGKTKDACKDWTTLANLGQVEARKKLAENCKN